MRPDPVMQELAQLFRVVSVEPDQRLTLTIDIDAEFTAIMDLNIDHLASVVLPKSQRVVFAHSYYLCHSQVLTG